jgi:tRNA(fMet)-specific endonuclease VapC
MNDIIVPDTNAIITLFKGSRLIAGMLGVDKTVIIPAIVCGEFEAGAQGTTKRERVAMTAFNGLLSLDHVSVLPVTRRTGRIYAQLFIGLKKAGTPIPTNDIWIAASALECGGLLLTNDHHFHHIPNLTTITF